MRSLSPPPAYRTENLFTVYACIEDDIALNAGVEGIEGDARALSHARRFYQYQPVALPGRNTYTMHSPNTAISV